jgi:hypothetical protein
MQVVRLLAALVLVGLSTAAGAQEPTRLPVLGCQLSVIGTNITIGYIDDDTTGRELSR